MSGTPTDETIVTTVGYTVTNSHAKILEANETRRYLGLQNNTNGNVYMFIKDSIAASDNSSIVLEPGNMYEMFFPCTGEVWARTAGTTGQYVTVVTSGQ